MEDARNKLFPAKYGAAGFGVEDRNMSGGRLGAHHVYPGKNQGFVEDLGLRDRKISLNAFVVGKDYMSERDALLQELEKPGPRKLVHPDYGTVQVSLDPDLGFTISESAQEGLVARFQLNFIRVAEDNYPTKSIDNKAAVLSSAKTVRASSKEFFLDKFKVKNLPEFIRNGAGETVSNLITQLKDSQSSLWAEDFTGLDFAINTLTDELPALLKSPEDLVNSLQNIISLPNRPEEALSVMINLAGFAGKLPMVPNSTGLFSTPSRLLQSSNNQALSGLISQTATAALSEAMAIADFDNFDTANVALKSAVDVIDQEIEQAASIADLNNFNNLENLRSDLIEHVRSSSADLARIVSFQTATTRPALLNAYDLYQDLSRVPDLTSRNKVKHPGFMPGGTKLEVLNV